MQQIDYVRIKNYKCLKEFEPGRINILVGRNNTGKSSVLEAISLVMSSLNDFKDLMENNLISIAIRGEDNLLHGFKIQLPLKYLINSEENKSGILLKKEDNNLKLYIEYFKEGYPESDISNDTSNYFVEYIDDLARERKKIKYEEILKKLENVIESEIEEIFNKLINAEKVFFSTYLNNEILRAFCLFATGEHHTFIKKISVDISPIFDEDISYETLSYEDARFEIEEIKADLRGA
jgi:AAA15 family ATPase/GTPase